MKLLFVIDGLDGSGKQTQAELVSRELAERGYNVMVASFPAYDKESSSLVKMYLHGEIGKDPMKITPYAASVFYAADRYIQFQTTLNDFIESTEDTILVCDRYISANIIHQGGKIESEREREKFYDWCYEFETELLGLPRETQTIMLLVEPEISQKLMDERYKQSGEKDIHENNLAYLTKCYESALHAAAYNEWETVYCTSSGEMRSREDIKSEVMMTVERYIAAFRTKEG